LNTFESIVNTLHKILKRWRVAMIIRRGDIFYADLRPVVGSEQGGIRPVIILQNDAGNRYSPTVICAAITSKMNKAKLPTHVPLDCRKCQLEKNSVILLEQIRTIDKSRLREKVCHLNCYILEQVDKALKVSLNLDIT
jgi:mRNA interferase MazF